MLFILKDLFNRDKLSNIFTNYLSDQLRKINKEKIPESYVEVIEKNIVSEKELKLGKVKFNDKVLSIVDFKANSI